MTFASYGDREYHFMSFAASLSSEDHLIDPFIRLIIRLPAYRTTLSIVV